VAASSTASPPSVRTASRSSKIRGAAPARAGDASDAAPFRYVAARAQYDPVRLSPPLTILTLFRVAARYFTPWVRLAVPGEEAS